MTLNEFRLITADVAGDTPLPVSIIGGDQECISIAVSTRGYSLRGRPHVELIVARPPVLTSVADPATLTVSDQ